MLASHLIRELQKSIELWGDCEVVTEGCDCYGDTYCVQGCDCDDTIRGVSIFSGIKICRSDPFRDADDEYNNREDTEDPLGKKDE